MTTKAADLPTVRKRRCLDIAFSTKIYAVIALSTKIDVVNLCISKYILEGYFYDKCTFNCV